MINDAQNSTRGTLGKAEARLLSAVAHLPTFSIEEAKNALGMKQRRFASQFLDRLLRKGWIGRVKRGRFAVIPLSSGDMRSPQLHEFVVAMELVKPAAIGYLSALNHYGLTEQLPRTVFVVTDHSVRRRVLSSLGFTFKIVSVRKQKFFGLRKAWINEQVFMVTDREKTIVDALDLPKNVGGIGIIASALRSHWKDLDEDRLQTYAARIGNSAVAKRLGFLLETLGLGNVESLRAAIRRAAGYPRLDPTLPARGKYNRRWGLLINAKVTE